MVKQIKPHLFSFIFCIYSFSSNAQSFDTYRAPARDNICPSHPEIKVNYRVSKEHQLVSFSVSLLNDDYAGKNIFLEGCKVINHKNWVCGGDRSIYSNGAMHVSTKITATNGRIDEESAYVINVAGAKMVIGSEGKTCFYEKNADSFKLMK